MKRKKLILQPDYVKNFKCTGNDCIYDCCSGWSIHVDKKTFKNYRKINNTQPIKRMINKNIKINKNSEGDNDYAKIILDDNKKCPFLNENRLCNIQMECGENYLSKTCNQYPRIVNIVDNVIERSCFISCPEIVKLLFKDEIMSFDEIEEEIDISRYQISMTLDTSDSVYINQNVWKLRETSIDILQNRKFKIHERIFILGFILDKVQRAIDDEEQTHIPVIIDEALEKYCSENIKEYLNHIEFKDLVQLDLINAICNTEIRDENNIANYNNLFSKFLEGINYNAKESNMIIESYKKGKNIYDSYFETKENVLENYFVNDIFSNLFPIKSSSRIFEEYCVLVIKFALIKIFLSGMANYYNVLDDEKVMETLYLYARNIEHSKGYINIILEDVKKSDNLNMAFMSILIRN